jgi:hypothetical protein
VEGQRQRDGVVEAYIGVNHDRCLLRDIMGGGERRDQANIDEQ